MKKSININKIVFMLAVFMINKFVVYADTDIVSGISGTLDNCDTIIHKDIINLLNEYMSWIRILVPIAIIVFSIVDLFSAIISGKEEEMKKNQQRFVKRLIIGVVIFFVPTIVNFILSIINTVGSNYTTCGIK